MRDRAEQDLEPREPLARPDPPRKIASLRKTEESVCLQPCPLTFQRHAAKIDAHDTCLPEGHVLLLLQLSLLWLHTDFCSGEPG